MGAERENVIIEVELEIEAIWAEEEAQNIYFLLAMQSSLVHILYSGRS